MPEYIIMNIDYVFRFLQPGNYIIISRILWFAQEGTHFESEQDVDN
jgi:hypothetical protein